ncbi:MFS transporter [Pseudomonas syringae]|uniref:MFS transporter, DHA1 family, inner membrane transport protein n=1 Tax=Pseudomonas syringae TaxID=317 RepID=A0AB37ZEA7_PSESX|nr:MULTISPECIES: MFS transporter [Pseudomonas]MBI6666624.1 MFS transporter [Pseudomonas syringae]MBI6679157.1 MFS transporter [Pseudomonas syringae]MBI6839872.1 MFS transporter [Pseudomonas syringae]NAP02818.1 MFS transporter [Pseudomonas syringae]NAP18580.1 MFS transporter [Pseudomonas syringae]
MTSLLNPKVYVLTFTAFVMLSSEFIVAGLLPEIATGLHITVGNAGWLITAFALGMGIGAPVIAAFTHRVRMRSLLMAACVALFLGNTIAALTTNFSLLLIGRALGGVGVAIFWTNAALIAAAMSSEQTKSLAVSRVLIGVSIASVVGVPVGKAVSDLWHWEGALILMSGLSAVALLMVIKWIRPPESNASKPAITLLSRLSEIWKKDIVLMLLSSVLIFGGIMSVFSYLATFLIRHTGFPAVQVTMILALYGVADIVGNLMLAKRVPNPLDALFKRLLLILAGSLAAITLLGDEMWILPLAVAAVGGCHAMTGLLMGIDVLRRAGSSAQLIGAVNVTAINLGIMLGALAGGFLIDSIGLKYIGVLGGSFVLLGWIVRTRLRSLPRIS